MSWRPTPPATRTAPATHKPADNDSASVADAILVHMWLEARRQWAAHNQPVAPPAPAVPALPAASAQAVQPTPPSEKPPKDFPQWAAQLEKYNSRLLGGQRRKFPAEQLLGAEEVLARLWHERTRTFMYKALTLGEILCRRTWAAAGDLNNLAIKRNSAVATSLRVVGDKLESVDEREWEPKSMLAVIDGVNAARCAWILLEFAPEEDVHEYADWFIAKIRSNGADKLHQMQVFWLQSAWRIAMGMRAGGL